MHSLAMAQDILEAALIEAEKHNVKHVKAISVKIGDGHFTESDSLQFCLEAATMGTIAEGAQIEVNLLERTGECLECALVFTVDHRFLTCPRCGGKKLKMLTDEEPIQVLLKVE